MRSGNRGNGEDLEALSSLTPHALVADLYPLQFVSSLNTAPGPRQDEGRLLPTYVISKISGDDNA